MFLLEFFLIFSCLGSIILGSLGALIQVKIKRFLAYTSIAQSGYIIIGLASNSLNGFISAFLYLLMYCIITLSFFAVLVNLEQVNKGYNISYLNQLYSIILYNKEVTFHFIIIILVMAAIPPFSSFFVKLLVFIVSIEAQLVIIILFFLSFSLLSTLYYLTFIQQLLFLKFNNGTVSLFHDNSFNIPFLRICSIFFSFSFFFLSDIYDFLASLLLAGLWPLTN